MLRSMTGQGHSHHECVLGTFTAELRAVNNRGFKLVQRLGDSLGAFEPRIEAMLRGAVRRGSIQFNAGWRRIDLAGRYCIDVSVVEAYYLQLRGLKDKLGSEATIDLARLTQLPGSVVESAGLVAEDEVVWSELAIAIQSALENFERMRSSEGEAMHRQLLADLELVESAVEEIRRLAPGVVDQYRDRLRAKVDMLLRREGIQVETPELLREVQIFADRSDISEELTRLDSHYDLFKEAMAADESNGRKLDFVIQEMFRETNTIGSKALDAEIARHVVDMKCALERMRELVQNIE
jgi:uncharacterized protein (TIGR00255 family)